MLVAAAVCPHPPLLVPTVAAGAAPELDDLRTACNRALDELLGAAPELLIVVGGGTRTRTHASGSVGTLAGFGVLTQYALGRPAGGPAGERLDNLATLPLSLTIGAWLLGGHGWRGPVRGEEIAADASPEACRSLGETLAVEADRVALLVMGDASACRSQESPGGFDPAAEAFDAKIVEALLMGDAAALLDLDLAEADRLRVAGRAPWQVLAGAVGDEEVDAEVLYDAAPYGVGYLVAVWEWHG